MRFHIRVRKIYYSKRYSERVTAESCKVKNREIISGVLTGSVIFVQQLKLAPGFRGKGEAYLHQYWNDFYPKANILLRS
jgi:hypothetical protein